MCWFGYNINEYLSIKGFCDDCVVKHDSLGPPGHKVLLTEFVEQYPDHLFKIPSFHVKRYDKNSLLAVPNAFCLICIFPIKNVHLLRYY